MEHIICKLERTDNRGIIKTISSTREIDITVSYLDTNTSMSVKFATIRIKSDGIRDKPTMEIECV